MREFTQQQIEDLAKLSPVDLHRVDTVIAEQLTERNHEYDFYIRHGMKESGRQHVERRYKLEGFMECLKAMRQALAEAIDESGEQMALDFGEKAPEFDGGAWSI